MTGTHGSSERRGSIPRMGVANTNRTETVEAKIFARILLRSDHKILEQSLRRFLVWA